MLVGFFCEKIMANYTPSGGYAGPVLPGTNENYFRATGRDQYQASGPNSSFAVNPTNYQQGNQIANPTPLSKPAPVQQQSSNNDWMKNYVGWDPAAAAADYAANPNKFANQGQTDPYAQVRGEISSGWDSYLSSLDNILNSSLPSQQTAQQNIINSQQTQGLNTLELQKTQGMQQLDAQRGKVEQNQAKTLKDLSGNLRNSFMAGNIYLGSQGAGDSSAANQYSYALTKMGNQQRGNVMEQSANLLSEIDQRATNLSNVYNTEVNNLKAQTDQKMNQLASWFAEQQNALRQQQAQGQLGKSKDLASISQGILNQAIAQANQIQQQAAQQRASLETWAMNNANNIQQLRSNMQQVSQFSPTLPQTGQIATAPQVDSRGNLSAAATGYGYSSSNDQNKLFNNPSFLA